MRKIESDMLGIALAGVLVSGCGTPSAWRTRPIGDSSGLKDKATIVVPVKGSPISLQDPQALNSVFIGILGVAIKEAVADKPKREALVKKIGEVSAFSSEQVLAEECVDIIKTSGWNPGTNVTLYSGLEVMHGAGPEIEGETRVFKTTYSVGDILTWKHAYTKWMNSGPMHTFSTNDYNSGPFVILEVTIWTPLVKSGHLYLGAMMKVMDPITGQCLASGSAGKDAPVRPLKQAEDLGSFVEDFRKCARALSEQLLKQLKVIP